MLPLLATWLVLAGAPPATLASGTGPAYCGGPQGPVPAPRLTVVVTGVTRTADRDLLTRQLRRQYAKVNACLPSTSVNATAVLQVAADGRVVAAQVSEPQPAELRSCLTHALIGGRFDAAGERYHLELRIHRMDLRLHRGLVLSLRATPLAALLRLVAARPCARSPSQPSAEP